MGEPGLVSSEGKELFYPTRAIQKVYQSLERIAEEEIIGIIIGRPGIGKNQGVTYWQRKRGARVRHISIEADVLTSPRPIINALLAGLRCAPGKNLWDSKRLVEEALARDPIMLIINESDCLTIRTLELLRSIWDAVAERRGAAGERAFPLVLLGAPRLRDMLSRADLERLHRRVFHFAQLDPLSMKELAMVLRKWPVRVEDDALPRLLSQCRGSFGWLNAIMRIAARLAAKDGNVITDAIVAACAKDLVGLLE